jgi:hypothetical protein
MFTARLKKQWQRIGIRVAGSWILAVSMLAIALAAKR